MTERYRGKWLTLHGDDMEYILPESDILPHSNEKQGKKRLLAEHSCPCKPRVQILSNFKVLVIHNSFQDEKYLNELLTLSATKTPSS